MWLTGEVCTDTNCNQHGHAQGTRGQAVGERTRKQLLFWVYPIILKISLADLSCNSLYEDDHYLLEHILNWNTADQFHQPYNNSDNSQHHDCQFCPGSPRCGVTNDHHRNGPADSGSSPTTPLHSRNGRYVKYLTSTCSPRIH